MYNPLSTKVILFQKQDHLRSKTTSALTKRGLYSEVFARLTESPLFPRSPLGPLLPLVPFSPCSPIVPSNP